MRWENEVIPQDKERVVLRPDRKKMWIGHLPGTFLAFLHWVGAGKVSSKPVTYLLRMV